ncbi:MAG: molybdopterin-binding protein [Methanospirillum sp.]
MTRIRVRTVRVAVIPTGGELVPPGKVPGPGESIASNPIAIRALLAQQGAETVAHEVVPDDPEEIRVAIEALQAEADLIVVCGGSGRGTRDVVFDVVRSLGDIVIDGVAARPGRAFLVVRAGDVPVVSLPGRAQPVGLLTEYFLAPLLAAWGLPAVTPPLVRARLGLAVESDPGFTETIPLSVARVERSTVGLRQPRGRRGTHSQLRANARLLIPDGIAGYAAGDEVDIELLDDPDGPARTVLVAGAVEGLGLLETRYRIAVVPCDEHEAQALLDRSACHLAVLKDAPDAPMPTWQLRLGGYGDLLLAAPPGLAHDPKVRAVLTALNITR